MNVKDFADIFTPFKDTSREKSYDLTYSIR